jgi:hypothetical protein
MADATCHTREVLLERGPGGFGIRLGPVVIRTPEKVHTILEVTDVGESTPAHLAGVVVGDFLLEIAGANVRGTGADGVQGALERNVQDLPVPWRFLRVVDPPGETVAEPARMALVLKAHQDHAASRVQAAWRGWASRRILSDRKVMGPPSKFMHRAAVRIQARFRGFAARTRFWLKLEQEAERLAYEMHLLEVDLAADGVSQPELCSLPSTPSGDVARDWKPHKDAALPAQHDILCTITEKGSLGIFFGSQGALGPVCEHPPRPRIPTHPEVLTAGSLRPLTFWWCEPTGQTSPRLSQTAQHPESPACGPGLYWWLCRYADPLAFAFVGQPWHSVGYLHCCRPVRP